MSPPRDEHRAPLDDIEFNIDANRSKVLLQELVDRDWHHLA